MNQRVVETNFGDLLLKHRNARGLTQRALSAALTERGSVIDPTSITRMENGQREPRLWEALAISSYLGFDLTAVTSGPDMSFWGHRDAAQAALNDARIALVKCFQEAALSQVIWDDWDDDRGRFVKERHGPPNTWLDDGHLDVETPAWHAAMLLNDSDEELLERVIAAVCRVPVQRGPGEPVQFGDWGAGADT